MKSSENGRTSSIAVSTCDQSSVSPCASATALVSCMVFPEKKRRCSTASSRSRGLSNTRPPALTTLSLPITHSPGMLTALAIASCKAISCGSVSPSFSSFSSTCGFAARYSTPAASSICRLMELVEARIRAKRTTLWKSREARLARCWGASQLVISRPVLSPVSMIHPRGQNPSPACELRVGIVRLANFTSACLSRPCWQFREPRLNPATPRPITSSILESKYIRRIRRVASVPPKSRADKPLLAVLNGERRDPVPMWMMRQAGRYLPEYRKLRQDKGSFLDLVYDSKAAAEVTLQPLKRFPALDGAILFSDILIVPFAIGQNLTFVTGEGPRLTPTMLAGQLDDLTPYPARLDPIYETVRKVKAALDPGKTLIGFAGSPWTVATYMVSGQGSRDQAESRRLAYADPGKFGEIVAQIESVTLDYLSGQVEA